MSHRKARNALWNENPKCHWCEILTIIPEGKEISLSANHATLDHLYSKWEIRELPSLKDIQRTVLACNSCNERRGYEAQENWLNEKRKESRHSHNQRLVNLGEILQKALNP